MSIATINTPLTFTHVTAPTSGPMTVFRRAVNKRSRKVHGRITNATRPTNANYLICKANFHNEFGKQELPIIEAGIRRDIKKTFDNAKYNPAGVRVVNVQFDENQKDLRGQATAVISIEVQPWA